jgi:RNA polymerase sigma factor (sigma-70 family)
MDEERDIIAAWVAREILPHEGATRKWLARRWRGAVDADDVIQEAYCRIAGLACVDHIRNGAAYFRRTVHAVASDVVRRNRTTNVIPVTENQWSDVLDDEPRADRSVEASQELERVNGLLSTLSLTCRRVIELRRIDGLSQRETALKLGVSENVVENHIVRGLKRVLAAMAEQDADLSEREAELIGKPRPNQRRG